MVIVGKHPEGITLNPMEYLLDNDGNPLEFASQDAAQTFLKAKGFTDDDLECLVFEKTPHYLKIGNYIPATDETEAIIEREFHGQGYIFKDEEAYDADLNTVCYVPELTDTAYTHQSFLDLMDGQESLARDLFDRVDWQHPEALLEEDYVNCEYADCPNCGRMFACYEKTECPWCHAPYTSVV